MSFQNKYIKYKNKYLDLKKQMGGSNTRSGGGANDSICGICQDEIDCTNQTNIILECRCCIHVDCLCENFTNLLAVTGQITHLECPNKAITKHTGTSPAHLLREKKKITDEKCQKEMNNLIKRLLENTNIDSSGEIDKKTAELISLTSRACPRCNYAAVRPHGHACHHVTGCPNCQLHYCFVCGSKEVTHNCSYKGRRLGSTWTTWCEKTISEKDIDYSSGIPRDNRCGCAFCSDCRLGKKCEQCPGNCLVCKGIVKPGPTEILPESERHGWCLLIPTLETHPIILTQTLGVDFNDDPELGHILFVSSVAVQGNRIISGSVDHTIKIWSPNDAGVYTSTQTLGAYYNENPELGHTNSVYSVAVDGDCIISCSGDHTIKIWSPNDAGIYTCTQTLGARNNQNPELGHTSNVSSVAVQGNRIISGSDDRTIKIWSPNDAVVYTSTQTLGVNFNEDPTVGHTHSVNSVAFHEDRIISGSEDQTIKIWSPNDAGVYTSTQTLGVNFNEDPGFDHSNYVNSVAFQGNRIISGSGDHTIKIWSPNDAGVYTCTQTLGATNNQNPELGHTIFVSSVAVQGNRIISGSGDRTIKIWDIPL
jgi:WD40 repeat protein